MWGTKRRIFYGATIIIIMLVIASFVLSPTPTSKVEKGSQEINGEGDYSGELNCKDPTASKWAIAVSAVLMNHSMIETSPDFIMVSVTHYRDGEWHVYKQNIAYAEGAYANVALKRMELDPSETYRIIVDTDPDALKWYLYISEEWQ